MSEKKSPNMSQSGNSDTELNGYSIDIAKQLVEDYSLPCEFVGVLNDTLIWLYKMEQKNKDTSCELEEENNTTSNSSLNSQDMLTGMGVSGREAYYVSDTRYHIQISRLIIDLICVLFKALRDVGVEKNYTPATLLLVISSFLDVIRESITKIGDNDMCLYLTVVGQFWDRHRCQFSKDDISSLMIENCTKDCRFQSSLFSCKCRDADRNCQIDPHSIEDMLKSLVDAKIFGVSGVSYYVRN